MTLSTRNSRRHTKPCVYFQTRSCPLSASECDFAHVLASSEEYEAVKNPQATLRTKPCRFFLGGQCKDGYWCRFKHPANLFASSMDSDVSFLEDVPELESDKSTDDDVDVRELNGAFKAKPEEHPKYRSRPCRNFLLGRCIYGERCSYLHVSPSPKASANYMASPPSKPYFPMTPPPHRVPNSTPINTPHRDADADVDVMVLDSSSLSTPIRSRISSRKVSTPSTVASSRFTEDPMTPATPGNNDYDYAHSMHGFSSFPISPLSYAPKGPGPLDGVPLSPPFSMFSPTSPVPLRIVHVPFAVPMYQDMLGTQRRMSLGAGEPAQSRPRAFSQPDVSVGTSSASRRNSHFRSKPCKFFNETGRCHKGDRCNFSHAPASSLENLAVSESAATSRRESATPEQREHTQHLSSPIDDSDKSGNFYKINWRVVGGGVKMGNNNSVIRRHSEDTTASVSTQWQSRPVFKNPFNTASILNGNSPLGDPIDLKGRTSSLATGLSSTKPVCPAVSSSTLTKRNADNALSLTLQAFSLSPPNPVVVIQGESGYMEKLEFGNSLVPGDASADSMREPKRCTERYFPRAKSSPSSPVNARFDLDNNTVLFSAESP